ncbi:MAG TPA: sporulation integral membrane protein YlbJ [Bacillota bacterium]|nr:sporulation integral membrane protein YlbJ [Bacillota bacterium]
MIFARWFSHRLGRHRKQLTGLLLTICAVLLIICLVLFPQAVFLASKRGLKAWWEIVFPSLLPFFIGSELLIGLGVVRFMGVLLEPVMRPLFNLPGAASFVVAVGFTSGFPIGAAITAQLRKEKLISRWEGERVMSFSNNASPLFMLAAVAVGMFHNPRLGFILAAAHYGANLTLGLIMGMISKTPALLKPAAFPLGPRYSSPGRLLAAAFSELLQKQREDWQPLGQRLSSAITKSINTLLMIGGFIIFFSVLIELLNTLGFLGFLARQCAGPLELLGLDPGLAPALATGLFEITLGTKLITETTAPLLDQILLTAFLLSWSGISVHAQAVALTSGTDLKYGLFLVCRMAQAFLAALYSLFIFQWMGLGLPGLGQPGMAGIPATAPLLPSALPASSWWQNFSFTCQLLGLVVTGQLILALLMPLLVRIAAMARRE